MNAVSLIVPFYNERAVLTRSVPAIVAYCRKQFPSYEIIFVDDGSTDGSGKIVKRLCSDNRHVRMLGYRKNVGRGYAVRKGMQKAKGTLVGYIDCDLEIPLTYVGEAVGKLDSYDAVIASKLAPTSVVHTPLFRRVFSLLYNGIARSMLHTRIRDHQGGMKFFRASGARDILKLTKENGWLWDTELVYLLSKKKYRLHELPVTARYGFRKVRGSFFWDFIKLFFVHSTMKRRIDREISSSR